MVFNGINFLFYFLPLFFLAYFIMPRKYKNIILFVGSIIFYALINITASFIIIILGTLNFILLKKYKDKKVNIVNIIINIIIYTLFTMINTNGIVMFFFAFRLISYNVDLYNKNINIENNYINYMLYLTMFPISLVGPIYKYEDIVEKIYRRNISINEFCHGFIRLLHGIFKITILCFFISNLSISINSLDRINLSFMLVLTLLITNLFNSYLIIDGLSDISIGLGKMLGFNFEENNDDPFSKVTIKSFINSAFISVYKMFREYLYNPLKGKKIPSIICIIIIALIITLPYNFKFFSLICGIILGILIYLEDSIFKNISNYIPNILKKIFIVLLISFFLTILNNYKICINNMPFINDVFFFYLKNYLVIIIIIILYITKIIDKIKIKIFNIKNKKVLYILMLLIYIVMFITSISFLINRGVL